MPAAYRATGAGTGGMPLVQREIAVSTGLAVRGIKGTRQGLVGAAIRAYFGEGGITKRVYIFGK